jgi:hypothetical protein
LPSQLPQLLLAAGKEASSVWIVKESRGKQGRGIEIVAAKDLATNEHSYKAAVAQEYEINPVLIHKRKFHLRVYLVIASLDPLRVLYFREGLALLAKNEFSRDPATFDDHTIHLTNAAVAKANKGNTKVLNTTLDMESFWSEAAPDASPPLDPDEAKHAIADMLVKLVFSGQVTALNKAGDGPRTKGVRPGTGRSSHGFEAKVAGACFDLFGVDVMFRGYGKREPFILEVNNGPELATKDPIAQPINHRVHTLLLDELVPLMAKPREISGDLSWKFRRLLENEFIGTTLPPVAAGLPYIGRAVREPASMAGPEGSTSSAILRRDQPSAKYILGPSVVLKLCDDSDGNSGAFDDNGTCISGMDIEDLWRAFDESQSTHLFERIYPVRRTQERSVTRSKFTCVLI